MDTLTQGLLGAVTAQLGFRQRLGPSATWVAAAAAVAPDLDVFAGPMLAAVGRDAQGLGYITAHRGLSHSLLAVPLIALAVAGLWWWGRRWIERRRAARRAADGAGGGPGPPFLLLYACVFVAVLSHPLLDWCTTYGTQLFSPVTSRRFAADVVPIVDILYTPLLVLTLVGCAVVRRMKRWDGRRASLAVGWVGFGLSVAYLASGHVLHERAVEMARGLAEETMTAPDGGPAAIRRADAYPALGSILAWRTVVETDAGWQVARVRPLAREPVEPDRVHAVADAAGPWVDRARSLRAAHVYAWFAMDRLRAEHRRDGEEHVVTLHDMRYGYRPDRLESLWPLVVRFGPDGQVRQVRRLTPRSRRGMGEMIADAWDDIWGR
jgi:inner membrane protein